jgi:hypothetical protein
MQMGVILVAAISVHLCFHKSFDFGALIPIGASPIPLNIFAELKPVRLPYRVCMNENICRWQIHRKDQGEHQLEDAKPT